MKYGILLSFILLLNLDAQDTIIFRSNEIEVAKIIEVSKTAIKYKKRLNPDGPVYVVNKSDLFEIKYQDGTNEITFDPKYRFKTYNPSIYVLLGQFDHSDLFSEYLISYFGIGHDGLFKFLNINYNRLNVGAFYSLNLQYGKANIVDLDPSFGTYYYEANIFEIINPYGLQIDFGKDHFRVVFQGMIGPTYNNYRGQETKKYFGYSGGGAFGFKLYRSKFGIRILEGNNDYIQSYTEISIRYGLEF